MNIIYLITHIERFKNNTPPYFYIGSKKDWKGVGTYYGSSRHPVMKEARPEELKFEVIWQATTPITASELLLVEKQIQQDNNVCRDDKYFNLSIACAALFHKDVVARRVEKFKVIANSKDEDGVYYKDKWSDLAKQTLDIPDSNGLTRRQKASIATKARLTAVQQDGLTEAQKTAKKTYQTNMLVDSSGLNQYQKNGITLSKKLSEINPATGNTYAFDRAEGIRKRIEVIGVCFYSTKDAKLFFNCDDRTLDKILQNKVSFKVYNRLCKILSKEQIDNYIIPFVCRAKEVVVCGEVFQRSGDAALKMGMPTTAFDNFILRGIMSKKIKHCLIDYFGIEKFNEYYGTESE